ncbi:MAG: M12 family metallo-peptidase [Draconibacterium sp.]
MMKKLLNTILFVSALVFSVYAQNKRIIGEKINIDISNNFEKEKDIKIFKFDLSALDVARTHAYELVLTENLKWNININENKLLSENLELINSSQKEMKKAYKFYKGYVENNKENIVRMTVSNNEISGYIQVDTITYHFIPLRKISQQYDQSNLTVVYKSSDLFQNDPNSFENDFILEVEEIPSPTLKSINYHNPVRILRIAVEGDYEFYQNHGSNSQLDILAAINEAEGVYNSTFNILFRIVHINVHTSSNDPYSEDFNSVNKDNYLNEIETYFNSDLPGVYCDVAFLFSGKPRTPKLLYGFARQPGSYGTVCDTTFTGGIFAHELGHNLNGRHEDAIITYPRSVMHSIQPVSPPLYFSASNISRITNNISSRLITYSYITSGLTCNFSNTFTVSNIPSGFTVSWPKSSSLSFSGSSTGSSVTIVAPSNGGYWVQPTLSRGNSSNTVSFPKDEFWVGKPDNSTIDFGVYFTSPPNNIASRYQSIGIGVIDHPNYTIMGVNEYHWDFGSWSPYVTGYASLPGSEKRTAELYLTNYAPSSQIILVAAENYCGHELFANPNGKMFHTDDYSGYYYLAISPNPASGEAILSIKSGLPEETVLKSASMGTTFDENAVWDLEVYDNMQSLKLKKQKLKGSSATINTQSWKEGVYMVRVKFKDEMLSGKLVVKK